MPQSQIMWVSKFWACPGRKINLSLTYIDVLVLEIRLNLKHILKPGAVQNQNYESCC